MSETQAAIHTQFIGGKMSEPIYVMFQLRMNESWYQLSSEAQGKLLDQLEVFSKKNGVEQVILCESGWSNDEWQFFGVDKHQNAEKAREHYKDLESIQWYRYITSKSIYGLPWSRP
jgi:hypothetical protein